MLHFGGSCGHTVSDGRDYLFGFGVCVPTIVGLVGRRSGATEGCLPLWFGQIDEFNSFGGPSLAVWVWVFVSWRRLHTTWGGESRWSRIRYGERCRASMVPYAMTCCLIWLWVLAHHLDGMHARRRAIASWYWVSTFAGIMWREWLQPYLLIEQYKMASRRIWAFIIIP